MPPQGWGHQGKCIAYLAQIMPDAVEDSIQYAQSLRGQKYTTYSPVGTGRHNNSAQNKFLPNQAVRKEHLTVSDQAIARVCQLLSGCDPL